MKSARGCGLIREAVGLHHTGLGPKLGPALTRVTLEWLSSVWGLLFKIRSLSFSPLTFLFSRTRTVPRMQMGAILLVSMMGALVGGDLWCLCPAMMALEPQKNCVTTLTTSHYPGRHSRTGKRNKTQLCNDLSWKTFTLLHRNTK